MERRSESSLLKVLPVWAYALIPFFHQKKIADIPVFDSVAAHVELVEGNNILREVIPDTVIRSKLTGNRFF